MDECRHAVLTWQLRLTKNKWTNLSIRTHNLIYTHSTTCGMSSTRTDKFFTNLSSIRIDIPVCGAYVVVVEIFMLPVNREPLPECREVMRSRSQLFWIAFVTTMRQTRPTSDAIKQLTSAFSEKSFGTCTSYSFASLPTPPTPSIVIQAENPLRVSISTRPKAARRPGVWCQWAENQKSWEQTSGFPVDRHRTVA